jgi:hypothetical protein
MAQQIHFVHEQKPGTALDSTQVRALRSHVRKVNLERSQQKSTRRLENFRSLTITDFTEDGRMKNGKRKQPSQRDATILQTEIEDLPEKAGPRQRCHYDRALSRSTMPTGLFHFVSSSTTDGYPLLQCDCGRAKSLSQRRQSVSPPSSSRASPPGSAIHPFLSTISDAVELEEDRIAHLLNSCKPS